MQDLIQSTGMILTMGSHVSAWKPSSFSEKKESCVTCKNTDGYTVKIKTCTSTHRQKMVVMKIYEKHIFEIESMYSLMESCLTPVKSNKQITFIFFLQKLKSPMSKFFCMNTNNDVKDTLRIHVVI